MKKVQAHHVEFGTVLFNKDLPQSFSIRANPKLNPMGFPFLSDAPTSTQRGPLISVRLLPRGSVSDVSGRWQESLSPSP